MGGWIPGGGWFGDLKPTIGPVSFPNYFKRLSLKSVPFGSAALVNSRVHDLRLNYRYTLLPGKSYHLETGIKNGRLFGVRQESVALGIGFEPGALQRY